MERVWGDPWKGLERYIDRGVAAHRWEAAKPQHWGNRTTIGGDGKPASTLKVTSETKL
jgi:hypothetical protein